MLEVTELGRTDLAFAVRSAGEPHPRQYLSYSQLPAPSGASSLVGSQDRCVRQRGHTERPGICYVRAAYTHPDRAVGGQDGQVAVLEAGWSREDIGRCVCWGWVGGESGHTLQRELRGNDSHLTQATYSCAYRCAVLETGQPDSVSLSRVQLFATPWMVAPQGPLSMGFSRQEY